MADGVPPQRPSSSPREGRPPRFGLRLQLVLALAVLAALAFVPLFLAVASLTAHTLRANREEVARSLGRAVAGRLADDVAGGLPDAQLRDVALVSLQLSDTRQTTTSSAEGVVAIRIARSPNHPAIEIGHAGTLAMLRGLSPQAEPGERINKAVVDGFGPIFDVEVSAPHPEGATVVQVALRVGDQASRAAPLLRLVAFYTASFACVMIVFAYLLLTRLIVRPIGKLVDATRRIEAGTSKRFDADATAQGAAEVAELGAAIARTTARLVEREEALAAKVEQLESAKVDLLAARDAIVRSERLASVGRLAAGLAHEVGNPIAALLGLEEVVLGGELDDETRDLVVRMKRETERVHRVLRDLLDFARADQEPASYDPGATASVREVADEVVALVTPQKTMRDIVLTTDAPHDLPPVRIAGGRLQQVLLNLVLNAADAIAEDKTRAGVGAIVVRARALRTPFVRIEIEDDGPGIPAKVRDHLFEPFVTTKDVGKGTGLGLAVCRGLVEGVGGVIRVEDREGRGARFVVELPTPQAPPKMRSVAPPPMR